MAVGQGVITHELLDVRCSDGVEVGERLERPLSYPIFLVCKALEQTRVGFKSMCLKKRVLVLQFQAFHEMTKDGESSICEVWCSEGDANSIKERCHSVFRTVTMLDLGLEFGQMLEFGINRSIALQSSDCIAS